MQLRAIWAQSRAGVIGLDGALPWHLPEDLTHFREATMGRPVIMGRRTWESFPARFRPLPGRTNIVLTRDAGYQARGGVVVSSLDEAIRAAGYLSDVGWVIGGGELYTAALPQVDEVWVTEVDVEAEGDVHAPALGSRWTVAAPSEWQVSRTGLRYRFITYRRR